MTAVSLLSRIILPRPGEPLDVRKLYLEESTTNARRAHATTRTSLQIGAESEVSFATYFNAFPASYWRRWSICTSVVLRVELTGSGRVDLYRTKATGARIFVEGRGFAGTEDAPETLEIEVGLGPFEDGGWIWFDVTTDSKVTLLGGGWYAPIPAPGTANIAVGIPTFNRPADCANALRELTADPLVDEVIGAVIVPDQGTRKVRDHPDFPAAAARLGDRLSLHDQPNLGGSGGYSRVMYEALKNTDCQQILFMDDDIRIEPDSILRVLAMSRFAKTPMLVGGQMLMQEPSHLHIMGEVVDRSNFMWTAAAHAEYDHDFAEYPLSDKEDKSKLLHRRIDVDYNGWWTCMIPRQVAEELGQPLPLFIKWDDADYGLRAAEHGYPTVTLPGAAIWHMAWSDKDDAIDWQAYFHLRNRLVVAAMHWDGDVSGLVRSHLRATLKHLACLEYSTVEIQPGDRRLPGRAGAHLLHPGIGAAGSASPAQGLPGRGGAAGGQRTPGAAAQEQSDEAAGQPAGDQLPAGPRCVAQPQAHQSGAPRTSGVQRADPGRALVPVVHGRRRDRHDRRRVRRRLPPARPGQDVHVADPVVASAAATGAPLRRDAKGVPAGAAGAVQPAEVGDGTAPRKRQVPRAGRQSGNSRAPTWLTHSRRRNRRPAKSPRWWPSKPRWPIGRGR